MSLKALLTFFNCCNNDDIIVTLNVPFERIYAKQEFSECCAIYRSKNENWIGTVHPNTQSLAGANRDVMQTVDFLLHCFLDGKKSHVLCKNSSVQKIANDGLSKTLVRACTALWDCLGGRTQSFCSYWSGEL